MLRHKLSSPKGRLLLSVLVLKDAGCNHYAVAGVDQVVSYESRHFADDGHKAFLAHLRHLLRVAHALVAPHRNVHSFSLPPSHRGRGDRPRHVDQRALPEPRHEERGAAGGPDPAGGAPAAGPGYPLRAGGLVAPDFL